MEQKPIVYILVGIPTSGKSTFTEGLTSDNHIWSFPGGKVHVVSRDTIRMAFFGAEKYSDYVFSKENEKEVTRWHEKLIQDAIAANESIIIDNTHCREKYIQEAIKKFEGTNYEIRVRFFDVPLWKAYLRNIKRRKKEGKHVPWKVLKDMKRNFKKINKQFYIEKYS